ncbi:MAG: DUF4937 domain-containing protein [Planctomycetota bacterium]|nr:DUF4937 domain-containing protein [Planctomycetota bacterium]
MYLKWINCRVSQADRPAFSAAQQAWRALGELDGFHGQFGGWSLDKPELACILGIWKHMASHKRFMSDTHDSITSKSGQDDLYETSVIEFMDLLFEIPGASGSPIHTLGSSILLRVVISHVHSNRQAHFVQMQKEIRNPGLTKLDGFMGGLFGRSDSDSDRFIAIMGWRDQSSHEHDEQNALVDLRDESSEEKDLRSRDVFRVALDPKWYVPSKTEA